MNKTLALVALLGLVAAPAFANEEAKAPVATPAKAEKVVAKEHHSEAKKEEATAASTSMTPAAEVKKEEVKK